ncbi:NmrA family transcriptional regulator [Amycolatopsis sp. WAC 01416]|uniref:SDR family oxidoreductase n=1 Tax=Amycolatopsis sp. WAC 01416 TaxID=2203196 RepID=UPI000F783F1A|nr:NAD(P)H-binding protein [Amycolatopsis sp. WAC 01416]RSN21493.1 NmrA family transcriptional regulator [Amycolatopsis sp. WAC 01416]
MTNPILVTGGTGDLGREVVRRLVAGDRPVRIMSRRPRPAAEPNEWARCDLKTGAGLAEAVDGVSAIIHCASTLGRGDELVTRNLVEAARRAGGPHLVYISIVGIDVIRFFYYDEKLASEKVIEESGLPWTVLRATQFHELVARASSAQRRLPVTFMPSGFRFQPVSTGDVADRLVELTSGVPSGRVPDMGGPEVRSARDLAEAYQRSVGRRKPIVPLWLPGKAARAFRAGGNLTPENATGAGTFEEFLSSRV